MSPWSSFASRFGPIEMYKLSSQAHNSSRNVIWFEMCMASLLSSTDTTCANRVKVIDHLDLASFEWMSRQFRCDLHICCNRVNEAINVPWPRQRIKMATWNLLHEDCGRGNKITGSTPSYLNVSIRQKFNGSVINLYIVFGFGLNWKDNPDVKNCTPL